MDLFQIYGKMPIWMQNLVCSVKGYLICRKRFNSRFFSELNKFEHKVYNQNEEMLIFLRQISNVPAYRGLLAEDELIKAEQGLLPVHELISKFPIIGKQQVKNNVAHFTNNEYGGKISMASTSGTTGGGLIFPYPEETENRQWAVWWRYRENLGISFGTWCGWFGGKKIISLDNGYPYWRINKPGKQVMFSSDHLTESTVAAYAKEIEKRKLRWLHGYPSHIARLAALMIKSNVAPVLSVDIITTGAENVLGNQVVLIKHAFPNAVMRQHYGLAEGVANISQDRDGKWQVDDDFAYVEFIPVDDSQPQLCRIVGTNFSNPAFPLVRYDTGDLATIEEVDGKIRVLSIDGRSSNFIVQPTGSQIGEAKLSIFLHDYLEIEEAQFRQKSKYDIELLIVKGSGYSQKVEDDIKRKFEYWFETNMRLFIKYTDKIERTKSGKLRIVVNEYYTD